MKNKYYWLDLFRFISALLVVVGHTKGSTFIDYYELDETKKNFLTIIFYGITRIGGEAVVVFFVLSGYLVGGGILLKMRKKSFEFKNYIIDRFSRIYVTLIPAIILTALVSFVRGEFHDPKDFLCVLFSLQGLLCSSPINNSPLWSLSYEVWCYIFAGIAAILFSKNKLASLALVGGILFLLNFSSIKIEYIFCWMIGMFSVYFNAPKNIFSKILPFLIFVIGIGFSQIGSASKYVLFDWAGGVNLKVFGIFVMAVGFSWFMCSLATSEPKNNILIWLESFGGKAAKFSFSLYLFHYPVLRLCEYVFPEFGPSVDLSMSNFLGFLVKLTTALFFSWVMYCIFERRTESLQLYIKSRKFL